MNAATRDLDAMIGLTKNEQKGLWAILWRVLLLSPILWTLGLALLMLIVAAFVVPPFYAALAFFTGDWFFGAGSLLVWFALLYFRRPILRWTLKGIEYGDT
jgi:hypothetical protein